MTLCLLPLPTAQDQLSFVVQDALDQWRTHIFKVLGKRSKSAVLTPNDIDKLALHKPTTEEELRAKVPLSDRKFEAYGRELLQVRCGVICRRQAAGSGVLCGGTAVGLGFRV